MRVRDLGELDLEPAGRAPLTLQARTSTLLGILLAADGGVVRAVGIGEILWPGQTEARQSRSLQTLVWRLRQVLRGLPPEDGTTIDVVREAVGYRVVVPPSWLDSHVFRQLARRAALVLPHDPRGAVRMSDDALARWRGGYLGAYGQLDWAVARRQELDETRDGLLETRWEALIACDRAQRVVEETAGLLSLGTVRERPWELRLRAQLALGRTADALQSYREVRALLVDELGIEPGAALRSLQTLALSDPTAAAAPPAPRATAHRQGRRGRRLPRLVGRGADVEALTALVISDDVDLITVVGPGGVGKTSLARQLAASDRIAEGFRDGVVWVDLAALREPTLLVPTVAGTLGLLDNGPASAQQLPDYLDRRRVLLVLDNVEQVVEGVEELLDVVGRTEGVTLLLTSRAALHVSSERVYELHPLPVGADRAGAGESGIDSPAVRLFVERARSAAPQFILTADNAAEVVAICARLDGLPLAIELAAARMALFSPGELLVRLGSGIQVLSGGPRDRAPRQRTLEDALAWSYELLSADEQRLFRRLGIFQGGCTVEAVEAVCGSGFDGSQPGRTDPASRPSASTGLVPDLLASLARKSLLSITDSRGRRRITLLQTVREYAATQLDDDERRILGQRHLDHFLSLVTVAEPELHSAARVGWLDALDLERDNLRQAWAWAQGHGDGAHLLAMAGALGWFWYFRGPISEGRSWLATALRGAVPTDDPTARAIALWHAGRLAHLQGDEQSAERHLEESAAFWSTQGSDGTRGLAYVLTDLGQVNWFGGRHERGRELAVRSVAAFRECGDLWGLGLALQDLGQAVVSARELDEAVELYEEIMAIYVELDDPWGRGLPLLGLGRVAMERGEHDEARRLLGESLETFESLVDRRMIGQVLQRLGDNETRAAEPGSARRFYRRALLMWEEVGNQFGMTLAVLGLAGVAALEGHHASAVRLVAAATAWQRALGRSLSPLDAANLALLLDACRLALGEAAFLTSEHEGRRLSRQQLLDAALGAGMS